ncbi:MAG: hypothetical protein ACRESZ_09865, partial [Methylococcales bacterium]
SGNTPLMPSNRSRRNFAIRPVEIKLRPFNFLLDGAPPGLQSGRGMSNAIKLRIPSPRVGVQGLPCADFKGLTPLGKASLGLQFRLKLMHWGDVPPFAARISSFYWCMKNGLQE